MIGLLLVAFVCGALFGFSALNFMIRKGWTKYSETKPAGREVTE